MGKEIVIASLIALTVLAVYYSANESRIDAFEEWKGKFGVSWAPEEQAYRRLIFEKNLIAIERHNADHTQTYQKGINQFTIYTDDQFVSRYLMQVSISDEKQVVSDDETYTTIGAVDWTTKGGVSRVKNQGQCGSCWAFSAVGAIQSWGLVTKNVKWDLSEQQLVDCSRSLGNQGCNGGWPSKALQYVQGHGIASQNEYPYVAKDQACKTAGGSTRISGQKSYSGCSGLATGINSEPISVTVDASNWSAYRGGVMSSCGTKINHAVLLVGVGTDNSWKIKNSWGTSWGESGFIRLATGNTCGVCAQAGVVPT